MPISHCGSSTTTKQCLISGFVVSHRLSSLKTNRTQIYNNNIIYKEQISFFIMYFVITGRIYCNIYIKWMHLYQTYIISSHKSHKKSLMHSNSLGWSRKEKFNKEIFPRLQKCRFYEKGMEIPQIINQNNSVAYVGLIVPEIPFSRYRFKGLIFCSSLPFWMNFLNLLIDRRLDGRTCLKQLWI